MDGAYIIPARGGAVDVQDVNNVFPNGINIHFQTDMMALQKHGVSVVGVYGTEITLQKRTRLKLVNTGPTDLTVGDDVALMPLLYGTEIGNWVRRRNKMVLQTVQMDTYVRDLTELMMMARAFHEMCGLKNWRENVALNQTNGQELWNLTKRTFPHLGGDNPHRGRNQLWKCVVNAIMIKQNHFEISPDVMLSVYATFVREMNKYCPWLIGTKEDTQVSHMIPTNAEIERVRAVANATPDVRIQNQMTIWVDAMQNLQKMLFELDTYRVKKFGRIISATNSSNIPVGSSFVLQTD